MIFLTTLLLSVFITIALIPVLMRLAFRLRFVDIPDARKVHARPIPVVGGIAMAAGALVPVVWWQLGDPFVNAWLLGSAILVLFGMVDDLRGLGPGIKFAGQIAAALVMIFYGGLRITSLGMLLPDGWLLPVWLAVPLTLVAIVGVTNAVNLSDGLDGLAGGLSMLIISCIGYLAYQQGDARIGFIALALAGAVFGFLKFNTYPASVFMGDAGSQFLGFSAICLSLELSQCNTALSPVLPLLILGLPVMDTLHVFALRLSQGRSPFVADRNHFHHRLMGLGLHHAESVLVIYVLQTLLIVTGYALRFHSDVLLLGGYLVFALFSLVFLAGKNGIGWTLKRSGWFDRVLKPRMSRLRDEGTIIRATFRPFAAAMPLLLLITSCLPAAVPEYVSWGALGFAAVLLLAFCSFSTWSTSVLRLTLYLVIPFVVYLSETAPQSWMVGAPAHVHNLMFTLVAIFIIVISKFSRRREGFKSTPLDFLVFFLAVVFPNLPNPGSRDYLTGIIAAKIIIFYFCYEVMLSEMRGRYRTVALSTLAVLAVKGF